MLFGYVLLALFLVSLTPFLLAPSIFLTLGFSLPPFLWILYGSLRDLRRIESALKRERECLDIFVANAAQRWAQLKNLPSATISELDILGLAPVGARRPTTCAKALIEDIAKGEINLINASQESVLRPYRNDLETRHAQAAGFSNLSVKVGILGTFCGFIFALHHLSQLFANLVDGRPEIMAITLQNLAYAFVKSLFGLSFSILIGIRVSKLRHPLDQFYVRFDEALRFGREFVNRMTLADPAIHTSLVQVRNSLQRMEQRLFDHSQAVASALHAHGNLINEQTKTFTNAAQGMVDVQIKWKSAFDNLKEASEAFENRTSGAMERLERGLGLAGTKFQTAMMSLDEARSDLTKSADACLEILKEVDRKWAAHLQATWESASQDKKFAEWGAIVSKGFDTVGGQLATIDDNIKVGHAAALSSAEPVKTLTTVIDKLNETLRQQQRYVGSPGYILSPSTRTKTSRRWLLVAIAVSVLAAIYYFYDPAQLYRHLSLIPLPIASTTEE